MQLNVGDGGALLALDEGPGLEVHAPKPSTADEVLLEHPPKEVKRRATVPRAGRAIGDRDEEVIVKVLPDARQVDMDFDAMLPQVIGRADTGEHEELRRADRATADDDFTIHADDLGRASSLVLDASRSAVLDEHPSHQGACLDPEVRTPARRLHVTLANAAPNPIGRGHVKHAGTMLVVGVEVVADGNAADLGGSLEKRMGHRADLVVGVSRDANRAARAVVLGLAVLVALELLEVRKHLFVAPAVTASRRPVVVVLSVTAEVEHAVDRAAAADDLASRIRNPAVVHVLLRDGSKAPIELLLE